MMDFETRKRELRRTVGIFRRITTAADVGDTWHRRVASWMKPRHIVAVASGAAAIVLLLIVLLNVSGFSVVSSDRLARLALIESAVPEGTDLVAADLRVRASASARAITFVDKAITSNSPDPALIGWFQVIFRRPAPQVDPGRETIFLKIIDTIAKAPSNLWSEHVDSMIMAATIASDRGAWSLIRKLGDVPPPIRAALLDADAAVLAEVIRWMRERQARGHDVSSIGALIAGDRLELDDQAKALREQFRKMTGEMETHRDRRQICSRHVREFASCMAGRDR